MRMSWTESWSVRLVKARFKELQHDLSGIWRIVFWGAMVSEFVLQATRYFIIEDADWSKVAFISVPMCICSFPLLMYLGCLFPLCIHLYEKGIMFQMGSGGSFFKYEQLKSISFIDRDGFHLFVVRGQNKRGKEFERTAVVSPKVPDEEVKKFLFDVGQAYLCQTNTISGK